MKIEFFSLSSAFAARTTACCYFCDVQRRRLPTKYSHLQRRHRSKCRRLPAATDRVIFITLLIFCFCECINKGNGLSRSHLIFRILSISFARVLQNVNWASGRAYCAKINRSAAPTVKMTLNTNLSPVFRWFPPIARCSNYHFCHDRLRLNNMQCKRKKKERDVCRRRRFVTFRWCGCLVFRMLNFSLSPVCCSFTMKLTIPKTAASEFKSKICIRNALSCVVNLNNNKNASLCTYANICVRNGFLFGSWDSPAKLTEQGEGWKFEIFSLSRSTREWKTPNFSFLLFAPIYSSSTVCEASTSFPWKNSQHEHRETTTRN